MKYRSPIEHNPAYPDASNIHVKTTAGHCAVVGPEWRELPPMLHAAALHAGCEVDSSTVTATEHVAKPSRIAVSQDDENGLIKKAIKALLDRNDAADFTGDGIPKVVAVNKESGFTATKGDILAAWGELNEEAAQ